MIQAARYTYLWTSNFEHTLTNTHFHTVAATTASVCHREKCIQSYLSHFEAGLQKVAFSLLQASTRFVCYVQYNYSYC